MDIIPGLSFGGCVRFYSDVEYSMNRVRGVTKI